MRKLDKKPLFQGSLAVAEASRDRTPYSGFLSGLFEGVVRRHLFDPYSISPISETAEDFLGQLRRLLIQKVDPEAVDREGAIGEDVLTAFKQIGAFGLKIPKPYGGLGLSQSDYHRVATLLGSHDASTTVLISAHNSIGVAEPVKLIGTQEQQRRWLPRLAQGEISGFALTENGAGCDIWDLRTYAIPIREHGTHVGYRLTGEKLYTTNAPRRNNEFLASLLVVIAQIVDEPREVARPKEQRRFGAFVVDTHSPGCSCTRLHFMGVRGIYNGRVRLREVFVPVSDRLGQEGEGLRRALESLTVGRLTLPAACLGSLKQCLWLARLRAQQRVQYDRPIGEHTDIGAKIARMASRTMALEALVTVTGLWADAKIDVRLEAFLDFRIKEMVKVAPFFTKVAARSLHALSVYEKDGRRQLSTPHWERYLAQKSRELARKTLWATARHRQGLARNQLLLTRLVKASINLFALAALGWYAEREPIQDQKLSQCLVADFCSRVEETFNPTPLLSLRSPLCDDDATVSRLAKGILAGDAAWLEAGIIPFSSVKHDSGDSNVTAWSERLVSVSPEN